MLSKGGYLLLFTGLGVLVLSGSYVQGFALYMVSGDVSLVILAVGGFYLGSSEAVLRYSRLVSGVFVSRPYGGGLLYGLQVLFSRFGRVGPYAGFYPFRRLLGSYYVATGQGSLVSIVRVIVVMGGTR